MLNRRHLLAAAAAIGVLAAPGVAQAQDATRIALVPKALGIGFFEAAAKGAEEAAAELGNVEIIYTGPTDTTAEGQIEIINSLIAQRVDAIAISANDPDALVPSLKRAMDRGIVVVSWDSGVAPEGRMVHLNPSSNSLIGEMNVKLAADAMPEGKTQAAILSAAPTATNQNIWIEEMRKVEGDYDTVEIVDVVYGDDLSDKSYREAVALMQNYPDLGVIIAPTTVGILAASRAVEDEGRIGEIFVTGLGLPSEMQGAVESGATKSFAIWNPIDLGYSATMLAYSLIQTPEALEARSVPMGRMGNAELDEAGEAAMSEPFTYDASNVAEFATIF